MIAPCCPPAESGSPGSQITGATSMKLEKTALVSSIKDYGTISSVKITLATSVRRKLRPVRLFPLLNNFCQLLPLSSNITYFPLISCSVNIGARWMEVDSEQLYLVCVALVDWRSTWMAQTEHKGRVLRWAPGCSSKHFWCWILQSGETSSSLPTSAIQQGIQRRKTLFLLPNHQWIYIYIFMVIQKNTF